MCIHATTFGQDFISKSITFKNTTGPQGEQAVALYVAATFGQDFLAKSITFENTTCPEGKQAVALYVAGDRSTFFDCEIRGYQDTLCVEKGQKFYHNYSISGTVDFIFVQTSSTLIQNSMILVRKPDPRQQNIIVASGRYNNNHTARIILQNRVIMPDRELIPYLLTVRTYLARPWGNFSRAVFINNNIGNFIQQEWFLPWNPTVPYTENCYFAEFNNNGPGADVRGRVKWVGGLITKDEATQFTAEPWLHANAWLPSTGIPYTPGFQT
ncbi:probable pectinesterase/pectinesterase inhibitor 44 [Vicia villosa]|uniref:probable pectinesterase/pectinesterase inhibitor 44 n=1 Tax=Vicia villosa TaxID=3911 RepID=UPI00273BC3E8|nr:probable pectinesterase/pectinesterase inhibitor 44 [Vicia villosa]